ncbi:MAG: hypothetical protein ACE5JX_13280 [Acidobacteriota bacterium]
MRPLAAARSLSLIDWKSIRRDPMLRWLILYPVAIAFLLRWLTPVITASLESRFGFDLRPYYVLIMSFALLIMPGLCGMVIGFLLLDQRDDRTLTALQVTPLSLGGYLSYRLAMPMVLSLLFTLLLIPLAGLVQVGFWALLASALSAAPLAPLYALFLASFASNKVQGFALAKGVGVLMIPPLVAYFVASRWQLAFGLAPHYWPAKVFWMVHGREPHVLLFILIGLAYQGLLILALMRRFDRVMHS